MANRTSLTVIQLNDSHDYFDLHQEMFRQGGQAVYRPAGEENVGHTIGLPWFFFLGRLDLEILMIGATVRR
ncbi:MAG: hypothetical protein EHM37_17520 [Deltaproteobacteria bacterium]|nr:MAG: hypothetical protein EHM37_17520 [Deltaproteobacteria bacterium]